MTNTNEKEAQMAQTKYNRSGEKTKQVTAQEVYQLTSETLQEIFRLDLSDRRSEAQDIWDVLIAAAAERVTAETACNLLEKAPQPQYRPQYRLRPAGG
jgi:hypothetical protein